MRKNVYFRLDGYYGWGVGFYSEEKRVEFDNAIIALWKELHCDIVMPYQKMGNCVKLEDYWGRLYCHPMDLSGFINDFQVEKIENAMRKVGLNLVKTDIYDDLELDNHHALCNYLLDFINESNDLDKVKDKIQELACHV